MSAEYDIPCLDSCHTVFYLRCVGLSFFHIIYCWSVVSVTKVQSFPINTMIGGLSSDYLLFSKPILLISSALLTCIAITITGHILKNLSKCFDSGCYV